jgi:hypothetical protein
LEGADTDGGIFSDYQSVGDGGNGEFPDFGGNEIFGLVGKHIIYLHQSVKLIPPVP